MTLLFPRRTLLGALAVLTLTAGASAAQEAVRVGSKLDAEGALLGSIIIQVLEANGIATENRLQLGPTNIVRDALTAGEIDIYPEYTGNAGFFFSNDTDPAWKNPGQAAAKAAELDAANDIVWLKPAPANNTWAIALREDTATAGGLTSLEDLPEYLSGGGDFKLAASAEFVESPAALPAFQEAYGFTLAPEQLWILAGGDTAATIRAAAEQTSGVNAAMVYGTDGAIAALGLVVLEDSKGAQAVYEPAPTVRKEVLDAHPEIRDLLDPVFATLDASTLRELNALIQVEGQDITTVATDYLTAEGFLK
ncbi:ABC transporter substrate-binding protein [Cereibacter changlensis JA139]|uniref:ABC transporter substrate-binding protein n=2 Tax=Cereibacter changlensis TaxID=402884 RepID=A0A2T4JP88_9RHOB|nr:ABC transporter substrate-binding protein [Cereibacter changlensis]PTE19720.1 ABC transporter substrate-binding protein [Cereibacter changlensis JA139]PZX49701.1 osmoprotectant transport system substrate-binding protein [Cereibacter changlensis]